MGGSKRQRQKILDIQIFNEPKIFPGSKITGNITVQNRQNVLRDKKYHGQMIPRHSVRSYIDTTYRTERLTGQIVLTGQNVIRNKTSNGKKSKQFFRTKNMMYIILLNVT